MFTPKAKLRQKCTKKTRERETGGTVTMQLAVASSSVTPYFYL